MIGRLLVLERQRFQLGGYLCHFGLWFDRGLVVANGQIEHAFGSVEFRGFELSLA